MENSPVDQPKPPPTLPGERTSELVGDTVLGQDADTRFETDLGFLRPSGRADALGSLGHYEVLEVLGQGGFGIVFRAFDTTLQRVVAIKVMAPELAASPPARKRFLREARAAAQLRHENVVQIHAVEEQPLPHLVMEFVRGETLQQRLDRTGPAAAVEVVAIGRQVAEGLAAAHAAGLIHRDIKPANILIEAGPRLRVKITDFGLARAGDDTSLTGSGLIAGTPMYMSPEQAQGATLDHRADLFSLGSVLYQMAAGQPPFRGKAPLVVLKQVAEDPPQPIRDIIPETPRWLCDFISKLHAKNAADRFQSSQEVADLLADCEAKLKAKPDGKALFPAGKPTAPSRWKLWAAAAVLLSVLALGFAEAVGITHLLRRTRPATDANQPGNEPAPIQHAKQASPESKNWVQLFNGTNLTGWKTHPDQPGNWKVENGVLVASGPPLSHLISERGDYRDFHIRLEANVSNIGDSGLYFRADSGALQASPVSGLKYPRGYEAQILGPGITNDNPTGSVIGAASVKVAPPSKISADTWFTLEVIARGNHLTVRVNNRVTADFLDDRNTFRQGRFALQCAGGVRPTKIQIRKIEIRELSTN